jgi:hypothetical protein
MSIPRRIIQTGRTNDLSPVARASATNLKLLHPEWDHLFFDDEAVTRFLADEFPQYQTLFDAFPYKIQKFDFFRYLAVYRFGGFYFDLDILLWEPLTELLGNGSVFPFEELSLNSYLRQRGMDWEIGNYAFGAMAGDPFLEKVIENCVLGQKDPVWIQPMMAGIPSLFHSDFEVLNSTGPGLLTRTLVENPELARNMKVLFPEDVCNESSWHQFGSHGVHLMEGSWRSKGSFIRRRLANMWEEKAKRRQMRKSIALGPKRRLNDLLCPRLDPQALEGCG